MVVDLFFGCAPFIHFASVAFLVWVISPPSFSNIAQVTNWFLTRRQMLHFWDFLPLLITDTDYFWRVTHRIVHQTVHGFEVTLKTAVLQVRTGCPVIWYTKFNLPTPWRSAYFHVTLTMMCIRKICWLRLLKSISQAINWCAAPNARTIYLP